MYDTCSLHGVVGVVLNMTQGAPDPNPHAWPQLEEELEDEPVTRQQAQTRLMER